MRSSRSSLTLAIALAIAAATAGPASAHRRDEYLQAARLAIDPDRIDLQLDLTPGISLADRVIAEIDRDRDGVVSDADVRAYAARVGRDVHLELDGRLLPIAMVGVASASAEALRKGEGALRLRWNAPLPPLAAGPHRVRFRNDHHADIGVYLANVLVPENDRVAVTAQERDVDQREFTVRYDLHGAAPARRRGTVLAVPGGLLAVLLLLRARRSGFRRALPRRRAGRGPSARLSR